MAENAQGVPPVNPTQEQALMSFWMNWRNQLVVDTSGGTDHKETYNDAGVKVSKKVITEVAGVYTESKAITGP